MNNGKRAVHVSRVPESGWPFPLPAQALPAMRLVLLQSAIQNPKSRIQNHVSALRRSQLGHRHGQAIGSRMHGSAPWKTEETIIRLATVTCILEIWWLSPSPRGGKGKWAVRGPGIDHHSNVSPSSIARVVSSNASCVSSTNAPW